MLSNTKDLENAYKNAMDAEGSALKENETYLDGIQGRIDQFNNAVQTMWHSELNDDLIKWLVQVATGFVKIVDNIGLVRIALAGLFTLFNQKYLKIDFIELFGSLSQTITKNELADRLDEAKQELADITEKNKRRSDEIGAKKNTANEKIAKINDELSPLLNKNNSNPQFNLQQQLRDLETKREEISKELKIAQYHLEEITERGVQVELYNATNIDTSQIDSEIEAVENKLSNAKQQYEYAKNLTWDDWYGAGSKAPAKDREREINDRKKDIAPYTQQLEALRSKKDELVKTGITLEVGDSASKKIENLDNQLKDVNAQIRTTKQDLKNLDISGDDITEAENIEELVTQLTRAKRELTEAGLDDTNRDNEFKKQEAEIKAKIASLEEQLKLYEDTSNQLSANVFQKASFSKEELKIDDMNLFASELDKLSKMDNAGVANYVQSIVDLGDEATATQKSIAAYASTVQDGNYSAQAGTAFINTHNAALKSSGIAAKAAAIGYDILNAAISMGLSIAIQFLIEGLTMLIGELYKLATPTVQLGEELSELNSELSDTQSKLDSLNSELQTTQDRMAELLALPSLSFTEKEELENLKKQNAELERQIALQESLKESQESKIAETNKDYIDTVWDSTKADKAYYIDDKGVIHKDDMWHAAGDTKEALNRAMIAYESEEIYAQAKKELEQNDKLSEDTFAKLVIGNPKHSADTKEEAKNFQNQKIRISDQTVLDEFYTYVVTQSKDNKADIAKGINLVLGDENFANMKYGDDEEINAFLDELYAYSYKWQGVQGKSSKSAAIASVFDDTASSDLQQLEKDLTDIANDDILNDTEKQTKAQEKIREALKSTSGDYERLKTTMNIVGISAEEVAASFVQIGKALDSSTVEGVTAQYQNGVAVLQKYADNADNVVATFTDLDGTVEQIKWGDLFDNEGNAIDTQISKVLQGADETARKEFAKIAEAVNEGEISVESAMRSFSLSGVLAGYKVLEENIVNINNSVFKDIADDVSGLIDTFEEFGSALESVANSIDLVNQAQAEMANSGHVSIETALQLMETTDNWNEVLKVENGNITLVDGAMETLAQSKLEQVRTNLQLALSEVQAQLQQVRMAESGEDLAMSIEESTNESVRQLAANMEYLGSIIGDILSGHWSGMTGRANEAKQKSLSSTEITKTDSTVSKADLEKKEADLLAQLEMLNGVTATNFEKKYSSNKASGGTDTVEDALKNKFDELVAKYENELALISNERDLIEAEIDQTEARGGKASNKYYQDLIFNSKKEKDLLIEKKMKLEDYLDANKDNIDQATWTEMNDEIHATAMAIKECTTNLLEYYDVLEDLDSHYFEQAMDDASRLGEEIEFIQGLLEDEDVADESGNWTEAGITKLGLYVSEMERAAQSAEQYKQKINNVSGSWAKYQELLAAADGDPSKISDENLEDLYSTYGVVITSAEEYKEKTDELTDSMRGEIEAQNAARKGIIETNRARIEAIRNGIEKEIEAYEDYIDVLKDSLDAEKDLYDFKRNVEKQTKDIATLERRIASLSGSTNAADIAERKRLEAELYESKQSLNDTYYDHAKDAQSTALDEEAQAFRDSKEKYIEELELTLDNVEGLIENSMMEVLLNADVIYQQLAGEGGIADTYGVTLTNELTQPWKDASAQAETWKKNIGKYTEGCKSFVVSLSNEIKEKLGTDGVWTTAETAAKDYADFINGDDLKIDSGISKLCTSIQSIVDKWGKVKEAADKAYRAQITASTVGGKADSGNDGNKDTDNTGGGDNDTKNRIKSYLCNVTLDASANLGSGAKMVGATGTASTKEEALKKAKQTIRGLIIDYAQTKGKMTPTEAVRHWNNTWSKNLKTMYIPQYAKGTTGTTKDQFAITDEPWLGDELTMYATPQGTLSFMRAGSTVVPADLTKEIIKLADIGVNGLMAPKVNSGVTLINNAIHKPEINLSFEALVKAERIDEGTLPEVKKFVQQEINSLVKQMNYAIKGRGGR